MLRRFAARFLAPLMLVATIGAAAPQLSTGAHADFLWCWDDPIVSIQGHLLEIKTGQPLLNLLTMRNTALQIVIPSNVSGSVVLNDISAFPMQTTISPTGAAWSGKGSIPVTIKAVVTAGVSYSVQLTAQPLLDLTHLLAGAKSTQGTTNTTITLTTTVG